MSAGICFCYQISPPSRSRAHPRQFCFKRVVCATPERPSHASMVRESHIASSHRPPLRVPTSTFRHAFVRSCFKCPSRTLGVLNGTHRVQPKGKRMAFYFPFYPLDAGCPRVEAQVNARVVAAKVQMCFNTCVVLPYPRSRYSKVTILYLPRTRVR
jgi:hypothetical protein